MIPSLRNKDDSKLIGTLNDVIYGYVIEERNGNFECELQYPIFSENWDKLVEENIIVADASDTLKAQKFRIYKTTKPMNGIFTVYALHISFDTAKDMIDDIVVENQSCEYCLNKIFASSQFSQKYKGYSDIVNSQSFSIKSTKVLSSIAGESGSILDTFGTGAEILRDNYDFHVLNSRGHDNDVTIEYGKNLKDINFEVDTSSMITRIKPYAIYTDEAGNEITVYSNPKYVDSPNINNYATPYTESIDFSDKFGNDEIPTSAKLIYLAEKYFIDNNCDRPKISIKISFIPLSKCIGYEDLKDKISLCDTVTIIDSRYNYKDKAKVIKATYDFISERYESMEIGEPRTTLGNIIGGSGDSNKGEQGPPGPQGPPGADGNIGDFPDTLPIAPTLSSTLYGFANIELSWTFEDKTYYTYELYASKIKDFKPSIFDAIFIGKASSFLFQAKPNETWYFKVRCVNTHGRGTDFSSQVTVTTTKVDDLSNYVDNAAIGEALIGTLSLDRGWVGTLKGNYIDAKQLSVTDGNGKRTLFIDSFGNVSLDVTELKISSKQAATYEDVDDLVADLQEQIDGKIETYNQTKDPSTDWTTTELRNKHKGDIWYNDNTMMTKRWSGSEWILLHNNEAKEASELAQKKAQVFTVTPTIPYYKGDLWITSTVAKSAVVKTCTTTRTTGSYNSSDWVETLKYTDDSLASEIQNDLANMSIGSRNLILNSNFSDGTANWAGASIDKTITYKGSKTCKISCTGATSNKWTGITQYKINNRIAEGEIYTIGVMIYVPDKSTLDSQIGLEIKGVKQSDGTNSTLTWVRINPSDIVEGKWFKVEKTFTMTNLSSYDNVYYYIWVEKNGTFYVTHCQMCQGNKLSDWSPAPEDTETYTDNLIADLQSQMDGKIETWSQTNDPSTYWTTEDVKLQHEGDLWYNTSTSKTYRWNGTSWVYQPEAEELAKSKKRIFSTTPTVPYDVGDLWILQSDTAHSAGKKGQILTCSTARSSGSYTTSDWTKTITYTDDTAITNFINNTYSNDLINIKNQIDGKANTYYQTSQPHPNYTNVANNETYNAWVGDLWYNSTSTVKKTYIYTKTANGSNYNYQWQQQEIPADMFDMIDGKKSIYSSKPSKYYKDDLWILESDTVHTAGKKGHILTATSNSTSYNASHWVKKVAYTDDSYAKTVESKLTQTSTDLTATFTEMHNNGFEQGIVKLNKDGIIVNHSDINSTTQMKADGFFITDSNGEVIAELSNSDQWSQLKVEKVFAKNVENIYEGIANLYVDHSYTGETDGTEDKPFKSFADLQKYLELTPMINKDIWIYVTNPGFEITEQFCLHSLKGSGFIQISFDAKCVLRGDGTGINRPVVRLYQIAKRVLITGNRSSITASDGLLILDDTTNGRGMGIYATDITKLELDYLTINCSSNGIRVDNCDLYTYGVDFGKCACDVELRIQSLYYSSADCGSSGIFCKIYSASKGFWGNVSECQRPTGDVLAYNGLFYSLGNATTKNSCRFGSGQSTPTAPSTNQYTQSFNWTSHKTYCYSYSNWNDSECKQGTWSYGLRGGHMFFDLTSIRSFLSGTVLDGNTITLTRANNGGMSGGAKVYINGSSCSSASGTPSYGGQTLLGTLAWGETKTFSLPKAIVSGLKSGTYNSLAVYVNSTASDCYLNITNCSITLKVQK